MKWRLLINLIYSFSWLMPANNLNEDLLFDNSLSQNSEKLCFEFEHIHEFIRCGAFGRCIFL